MALKIWIITSGRRGDIVQCEAIARALSHDIEIKTVNPRKPWVWAMPRGPIDPHEAAKIADPFPDLIIAASRRAVPYARLAHQKSSGRCKVLFMKYPGVDVSKFALLWTPAHDQKGGPRVIETLLSPHNLTPEKLADRRAEPDPRIKALPGPRLGVLLGGNAKRVTYDAPQIQALMEQMRRAEGFNSIMVTPSRRTPDALIDAIKTAFPQAFVWDGTGDNPYNAMIAHADALLVTGDSHNMVSEALAAGVAVHLFEPKGNPSKFRWTFEKLREKGLIAPANAPIVPKSGLAFDETNAIVSRVCAEFELEIPNIAPRYQR